MRATRLVARQVSELPRASQPARQTASNVPLAQLVALCAGHGGEYSGEGMASIMMVGYIEDGAKGSWWP